MSAQELIGFLHSDNQIVQTLALQNVLAFTSNNNLQKHLFYSNNFQPICDLILISTKKGFLNQKDSLTCLINLADNINVRKIILNFKFSHLYQEHKPTTDNNDYIHYLIHQINSDNKNTDLMCMLLSNLTLSNYDHSTRNIDLRNNQHSFPNHSLDDDPNELESDNEAENIIDELDKKRNFKLDLNLSHQQLDVLLDSYLKNDQKHDYLSYVFINASISKLNLDFFSENNFQNLFKFLIFSDPSKFSKLRRLAASSILKNLLFNTEIHQNLLNINETVDTDELDDIDSPTNDFLTYLLNPLISSKFKFDIDEEMNLPTDLQFIEDEKNFETDFEILSQYLQSILLLLTTKIVRIYLRNRKSIYPIIRELHKISNNRKILKLCDKIVQLLMRDEEDDIKTRLNQNTISNDYNEESDSDDDKIVEIL
ncbi:Hgh1p ASCRUDRAFT_77027 [Ascoidea rubescens DSM 1968]|uniref:Protein HGH1 homolog n=1 Tax=Ascoidea rubescens DSM 1968 TaxID=1344418 RepID=A0A1D2VDU1_9ASCO|nr:hypothetical protein ASCRUDRAFT_77027 [Ascoidea rubescens DSM 1968]ODV59680.1 hypothetical protein ASCRUDRAFT_77027 [Ascoidea rubescens DSM 1968]